MLIKNSKGQDLNFEQLGSGEPLIMLHGAASSGQSFMRSGLAPTLAREFEVLLIDYTGLGRSARVTTVTPSQWCEDVKSVLDAVGAQTAHVFGASLGARVAGRVALDYPDRVASLLITAAMSYVSPEGDANLDAMYTNPATSPRAEEWRIMHGDDFAEVVSWYQKIRRDEALQSYLTFRDELENISAPTLLYKTDRLGDTVHSIGQSVEWHERTQDSWLSIAPGDQFSNDEALALILKFLDTKGIKAG